MLHNNCLYRFPVMFALGLIVPLFLTNLVYSQDFNISPLITIPGNNQNFDVASPDYFNYGEGTYICWENQLDSLYTIYLQKIGPEIGNLIKVYSDTLPNINPGIARNGDTEEITVVWQSWVDGHWQLRLRKYKNDTLGSIIDLTDSPINNINPSLSAHRVIWTQESKLLVKSLYADISQTVIIDSTQCSHPNIYKFDSDDWTEVVYEKGPPDERQIYQVQYRDDAWETPEQISEGENNINPRFGTEGGWAYQTFVDGVWRVNYFFSENTDNTDCNYENPYIFAYAIPTSSSINHTSQFLAFDSDCIPGNREIYIKLLICSDCEPIINVSNLPARDWKPDVTFLNYADSIDVVILWQHEEDGKVDIWWGRDSFNPIPGAVEANSSHAIIFQLNQNYPNPFNAATEITYSLQRVAKVNLSVFNIHGQLIENLVADSQNAGQHSVVWNAHNVGSGLYFYKLEVENQSSIKKCLLIK